MLVAGCEGDRLLDPSFLDPSLAKTSNEPAAPSNLKAAALSATEIRLDWQDNSTNEALFEIYRSATGVSGTYTLLGTAEANQVGYSNDGLPERTEFCYRLRSVLVKGARTTYSAFSNTSCATTLPTPPPPPPAPSAPSELGGRSASSSVVILVWTDNASNEEGFRIERSLSAGASWVVAGAVGADNPRFEDGGRQAEVEVCYRVVAFNAGGEGTSPTACTIPPAAPTSLTATRIDSVALDLQWTDNSGVEDAYEVWGYFSYSTYCPEGSGCDAGATEGEELIATLPADSTSYRCADCTTNVISIWVRASSGGGHSSPAYLEQIP